MDNSVTVCRTAGPAVLDVQLRGAAGDLGGRRPRRAEAAADGALVQGRGARDQVLHARQRGQAEPGLHVGDGEESLQHQGRVEEERQQSFITYYACTNSFYSILVCFLGFSVFYQFLMNNDTEKLHPWLATLTMSKM